LSFGMRISYLKRSGRNGSEERSPFDERVDF
jgi:hypothetical protein